MSRIDRRSVIGGLSLGLLAGCGEGVRLPLADGRRPPEGGIGGTGIVGVLSGFGSIRLGGVRVLIPDDVPVTDAFDSLNPRALAPGQSLTVEADGPEDALVARRIHVSHPLIGTVEKRSDDGRSLVVLGTRVVLEPDVTTLAQEGLRAAVSGLWRGDEVVASRVAVPLDEGADVMAGVLHPGRDGPMIGGLALVAPSGTVPPALGSFVTAYGQRRENLFLADRIVPGRFTGAAGTLERLVVEGYLEPVAEAPRFRLSGLGHSFDPSARLEALAGTRAVFVGPYSGDFEVTGALPLPEDAEGRALLLNRPEGIWTAPGVVATR